MSAISELFGNIKEERPYCKDCAEKLAMVIAQVGEGYEWDELPDEGREHYMKIGIAVLHKVIDISDDVEAEHEDD